MNRSGHCRGCGGSVYIWFTVQLCDKCMMQMADGLDEVRRQKV